MAISPSIPTSFVPRQQSPEQPKRQYSHANNIFTVVAFVILAIAVAASVATFLYDRYLVSSQETKRQQIAEAHASVDTNQVENYIRLSARLKNSKDLLDKHVTAGTFFNTLETITLQNVSFTTLNLTVASDRTAILGIDGLAKNFNALASLSNSFSTQKGIKQAIFSSIAFSKDPAGVSFHLSAILDKSMVIGGVLGPATQGGSVTIPVQASSSATVPPPAPVTSSTSPTAPVGTSTPLVPPVVPARHP